MHLNHISKCCLVRTIFRRKFASTIMTRNFTVCFEGNIGSGKTTCLEYFSDKRFGANIIGEPVNKWRDLNGINLFQMMYKDPSRWGFTFQNYVQLTMLKIHQNANVKSIIPKANLMERSIYSARYCFVENLYKNKLMNQVEYIVLDEWFKWIMENERIKVDLIVYLKTDPQVVYERIKKRSRSEEVGITLDYLTQLHILHEQWLTQNLFDAPSQVLTIDANVDKKQLIQSLHDKSQVILGNNKEFTEEMIAL